MSVILILLTVLFVICYLYIKLAMRNMVKCTENIPGMKSYPIIGNLPYVMFRVRNLKDILKCAYDVLHKYSEHGIVKFWLGPILMIGLWDPTAIEDFFSDQRATNKGSFYSRIFGDFANGVFLIEGGEKWKELRRPLVKRFTKKLVDNEFHAVFVKKSRDFIEFIMEEKIGQEFDIFHSAMKLFLDILGENHLGVQINTVRDKNFQITKYYEEYLEVTLFYKIKYIGLWNILMKFSKHSKQLEKCKREMNNFLQWILEERKTNAKDFIGEEELYTDFLLRRGLEKNVLDADIRRELADVVAAGFDTSAVVFSSIMTYIAMFPEVQEKAYQEQLSIFGDSSREPTSEDLKSMKYLKMVIKETLRKISPPSFYRLCTHDTQIGKYTIPKGAIVCGVVYKLHNNPAYWERPKDFYPEHFLPEKEASRPRSVFLPFGVGPRSCPGLVMTP